MNKIIKIIAKIMSVLNIKADKNQRTILYFSAITGLIGTYIGPRIAKVVISELPAEWIAAQALISAALGIAVGSLWKVGGKIRERCIRGFIALIITESLVGCAIDWYLCFIEWNVWFMAITSLIYSNFIAIFVSKVWSFMKNQLWKEEAREVYTNTSSIIGGYLTIIGMAVALIAMPSLKVALFLSGLSMLIDDIGYGIVYMRNKNFFFQKLEEEKINPETEKNSEE